MQVDQPDTATKSEGPFVLDILSLTNEARNAYGLRRQEYGRYRHHCTQRLHRIRKTLGFTHGKGKSFVDRPITAEAVTHEKYLHVLLFQAERAWGYAMEIKALSVALDDPRKQSHYKGRLRKAAKYAEQLESICSANTGKVDVRTALDAQAYAALMSGYVLFESQQWQEALEKFSAARAIYDKLSLAGTPHQEALCHAAMDEIDPNIRFCAYSLRGVVDVEELVKMSAAKKGSDVLMREIEHLITQTRQAKAQDLKSISWRSKTLPLRNAKLAAAILAAQDAAAELNELSDSTSEVKLEQFDKVLQAYAEAEKHVTKALKEDAIAAAKVKSSKSEQNTAELNLVATFINYSYLRHAIDRNLLLAKDIYNKLEGKEATTEWNEDVQYQNLVKAYDNVVQNLTAIQELPGVVADLQLSAEVENKLLFYKGWRCFFTATAYSKLSRHVEAFAVFDRAQTYATQIRSGLGRTAILNEPDSFNVTEAELQEMESKIRGRKCQVHAAWYLENGQDGGSIEDKMTSMALDEKTLDEPALIKCLNTYPTCITSKTNPKFPHLVDFPPTLQAIPAKPLFFDIAFNHMEYDLDGLAERAGIPKASRNESAGGGWFGAIWGRK
ncbi:signal recognition particle subunit srp68 [Mortierella sp. NVP85]|nr:signal recognition particle subunit srp68 [Mortierella sp. NVP85]